MTQVVLGAFLRSRRRGYLLLIKVLEEIQNLESAGVIQAPILGGFNAKCMPIFSALNSAGNLILVSGEP